MPLANIPPGTFVHNIELRPGKGAQVARSAGMAVQLMAKEGKFAQLKMPSGEVRSVSLEIMARIGGVGNADHENLSVGKAGRNRWLGIRPQSRGVVQNPVDHPHGGGEGKSPPGQSSPGVTMGMASRRQEDPQAQEGIQQVHRETKEVSA